MRLSREMLYPAAALLAAAAALAFSSLACNLPAAQSARPPVSVEPSEEALASFNSKWRTLSMATPDGPFTITFTEAELTSALVAGVNQTRAESGQDIPLENLQVSLRDGLVSVYATARLDPLAINGVISVVPTIGANGLVSLSLASIQFGPLQLEDALISDLLRTVEASINEPIQTSPFSVTINEIMVGGGQLTINGVIAP